jgi:O-acetyl-ADP-ribose deacetylase (regulator of RNase III)
MKTNTRLKKIEYLNKMLLRDLPQYEESAMQFPHDVPSQRRLLRSLMNVRPPLTLNEEFLQLQDEVLSAEREEKGIVDVMKLPSASDSRIALWQGDITRLNADAIVDADNSALLGCFYPCHGCIDNAIHSAAGLQLRDECNQIMQKQGHPELTGLAKITKGYNLPCKYVLHTVGPIIREKANQKDCALLASCYYSCLELAETYDCKSVAFCCISTGEYHFPNQEAAGIAVQTAKEFLKTNRSLKKVVFNVFKDIDLEYYQKLLNYVR